MGTYLYFDTADDALIGIGGFKGAPSGGEVELGNAIAPARRERAWPPPLSRSFCDGQRPPA